MTIPFTPRQGEYLAFIHGFTVRRGVAPSFEEIGSHFGTTPPSVNSMIKMLDKRGLLSRVPGAARSLRVTIPPSVLPGLGASERKRATPSRAGAAASPVDAAVAATTATLDTLLPHVATTDPNELIEKVASAVKASLRAAGLTDQEGVEVGRRVCAEAARWASGGRGVVIQRRQLIKSSRAIKEEFFRALSDKNELGRD
jgi:SOS-response transcriptional repressor LexA